MSGSLEDFVGIPLSTFYFKSRVLNISKKRSYYLLNYDTIDLLVK